MNRGQTSHAVSLKPLVKPAGQSKGKVNKVGEVYINAIPQVINAGHFQKFMH